ncbi:TrmH family RNA methyltransferase [Salegentibacter salegens]|uniref:SpoU rRNA Methylase family protein n=1 Tax=Salegentibacter salegens TaxID=143223 RepID=A0A1M7J3I3_9FLAO|nr:TrmH family RNA methyltransferase [Salegentibacter salegens]PRX47370.1 SpoU rRNA methylase family protein [Salegentibacter salegens]SHM47660.1 SpoU rRNA Methylase family protein [Salegentibacter salegens]
MEQLSHFDEKFNKEKSPVILLLDNITGEANIGSIFRLADAFNVEKIIFSGTEPNLNSRRLQKTARNTHKTVVHEFTEDAHGFIQNVKVTKKVYSLEITSASIPVEDFKYSEEKMGIILILGNEVSGINKELLEISDKHLHINMFGRNSSMNVAQATGIALYEMSKTIFAFTKK